MLKHLTFWEKFEYLLPLFWIGLALVAIFEGEYGKSYGFLGVAAYFMVMTKLDRISDQIYKLRKEHEDALR